MKLITRKRKHNHVTRDIRPHDCPECAVQPVEAELRDAATLLHILMTDVDAGYIDLGSSDLDPGEVRAFLKSWKAKRASRPTPTKEDEHG